MKNEKLYNKILRMILRYMLQGTWHTCSHTFKCKAASERYQEYQCIKCNVCATNEYNDTLLILVNPKSNAPYKLEPWAISEESTKGIHISINK